MLLGQQGGDKESRQGNRDSIVTLCNLFLIPFPIEEIGMAFLKTWTLCLYEFVLIWLLICLEISKIKW